MIEVINRQKTKRINPSVFKRLLGKLGRRYGLKKPEIVLAFVDDPEIRRLNRKFRKKDKPTDVLSFPIGERGADGKYYLGDIIISAPKAAEQAKESGHSLTRELEILAIHGFLHLLGYDHQEGHDEEEHKLHKLFFKDN